MIGHCGTPAIIGGWDSGAGHDARRARQEVTDACCASVHPRRPWAARSEGCGWGAREKTLGALQGSGWGCAGRARGGPEWLFSRALWSKFGRNLAVQSGARSLHEARWWHACLTETTLTETKAPWARGLGLGLPWFILDLCGAGPAVVHTCFAAARSSCVRDAAAVW